MAWINLALGAYAVWRASDLKSEGKGPWSWGTMLAAGLGLIASAALHLLGAV